MDEVIGCLKQDIESNSKNYPLNYMDFRDLLQNLHGTADPISITENYLGEIQILQEMMSRLIPFYNIE